MSLKSKDHKPNNEDVRSSAGFGRGNNARAASAKKKTSPTSTSSRSPKKRKLGETSQTADLAKTLVSDTPSTAEKSIKLSRALIRTTSIRNQWLGGIKERERVPFMFFDASVAIGYIHAKSDHFSQYSASLLTYDIDGHITYLCYFAAVKVWSLRH